MALFLLASVAVSSTLPFSPYYRVSLPICKGGTPGCEMNRAIEGGGANSIKVPCFDPATLDLCFLSTNIIDPTFVADIGVLYLNFKLVDVASFLRAREIAGFLSAKKIIVTDANQTAIACDECLSFDRQDGTRGDIVQQDLPSQGSLSRSPYTSVLTVFPFGKDDDERTSISDELIAIFVLCIFVGTVGIEYFAWKCYAKQILPEHVKDLKQPVKNLGRGLEHKPQRMSLARPPSEINADRAERRKSRISFKGEGFGQTGEGKAPDFQVTTIPKPEPEQQPGGPEFVVDFR